MKRIMKALIFADKRNMTREDWLEQRKKGLGGSDSSGILGLNPYCSAFQVYCDKVDLLPEQPDNEAMRQGRDFEEYVAKRFEEASGKKTKNCNYILQHPHYPFMLANVDRLIVGENAGLECKTTSVLNKTDFEGGDVPPNYYTQCIHYMAVTGAEKWYLAILVLNKGFYWFEIKRSEEEINALEAEETRFWKNHVEAGVEPAADGSERAKEVLKTLYPIGDDDLEVDLMPYEGELRRATEIDTRIRTLEKEREQINQELKQYMKEATVGYCGDYRVTWRNGERRTFDVKKFADEHRDVPLETYYKHSATRTFMIKKLKEKEI